MRHLRLVSVLMTVAGALLAAAGIGLSLDPLLMLVGLLLLVAGGVKIVVVALWKHLGAADGPQQATER